MRPNTFGFRPSALVEIPSLGLAFTDHRLSHQNHASAYARTHIPSVNLIFSKSSSCVPIPLILPSSITMIRSAFCTLEIRCAMMIFYCIWNFHCKCLTYLYVDCCINYALIIKELKSFGFKVLLQYKDCFCPPDTLFPPCSNVSIVALGKHSINSSAQANTSTDTFLIRKLFVATKIFKMVPENKTFF